MEREMLLLGLLRHGKMHGYQLNDYFERTLAFCADLKKATAYFLLDKMQGRGWVAVTETREGHRPPRKVYALTPLGEAEFQRLLRENLADFASARSPADVGLAFVDALDGDEAHALLRRRRSLLAAELDEFNAAPRHGGTFQLLIDHQINYLESELRWLDETLVSLGQHAPAAEPSQEK